MRSRLALGGYLAVMLLAPAGQSLAAFHFSAPTTYKVDGQLWSVGIGDFDGDGRQDFAAVTDATAEDPSNNRSLYIYYGKQGGGFATPVQTRGLFPDGDQPPLVAVDVNADGRTEIFIGHAEGIAVVHVDGARHITWAQASGPYCVLLAHGDVNGDGYQDIVSDSTIYFGNEQGGLQEGVPLVLQGVPQPSTIVLEDMNRDGRADLVVTDRVDGYVFLNQSGGFPSSPRVLATGYEPWNAGAAAAADFNRDGRIDVSVGKESNSPTIVSTFFQSTLGTFPTRKNLGSYDVPGRMLADDIDKDGMADLLVMHDGWSSVGIYFQTETGLAEEALYPSATTDRQTGMALGDLDGDDCTDIAVANPVQGLQVRYGRECATMDMAVAVGLTATTATVRVENESANGVIDQPVVEADLSIRVGSMQLTAVPDNCVPQQVSSAKTHVECLVNPIAAGQSDTITFGIEASPRSIGNRLTISASAHSPAKETNPANNSATKWINFWPAPSK